MLRPLVLVLLVSASLAGCIDGPGSDDLSLEDDGLTATAVTAHLHDLSEPIDGITVKGSILEQFRIAGPDGVELDTWWCGPTWTDRSP